MKRRHELLSLFATLYEALAPACLASMPSMAVVSNRSSFAARNGAWDG